MRVFTRNPWLSYVGLLTLAVTPTPALNAQRADGPPNVLVVQREYLKPGKGGLLHERSESAFVRAFAEAHSGIHYFALDSLSGPSRSLFLNSYDSFADWEKSNAALRADKTLSAALDHAAQMDGDLLERYDVMASMLRPDLSLNQGHIEGTRYFDIVTFVLKPGHMHDFEELGRMYVDAFRKVSPDAHWDCFQVMYGNPAPTLAGGDVFIVITTMKSLAEVDRGALDSRKFAEIVGASGMKRLSELTAASVQATADNLFEINPRLSNPPKDWIDREPNFWNVAPQPKMKK